MNDLLLKFTFELSADGNTGPVHPSSHNSESLPCKIVAMVLGYLKTLVFPSKSRHSATSPLSPLGSTLAPFSSPPYPVSSNAQQNFKPPRRKYSRNRGASQYRSGGGHESSSELDETSDFETPDGDDGEGNQRTPFLWRTFKRDRNGTSNGTFPSSHDQLLSLVDITHSLDIDESSSESPSSPCGLNFSPRVVSDAIIGLSDGLTVPFALTAGLSTFNDTRVVVYGGLAELIAGSISMGLGGWLAARGESEYYNSTVAHTLSLINSYHSHLSEEDARSPSPIPRYLNNIFLPYKLPPDLNNSLIKHILSPDYPRMQLLSLLIRFHYNLSPPAQNRATISALTISMGYFLGGFIPLVPYFFVGRQEVIRGLIWSVGVMGVCLFGFGAWKTLIMDNEGEEKGWKSGDDDEENGGMADRGGEAGMRSWWDRRYWKALRGEWRWCWWEEWQREERWVL
ncbi:VIT family-domain-containing protein [Kalaharituber pfeilii]|nr:VIT family-domain-containing protein [Kalaharituber pfeilii]